MATLKYSVLASKSLVLLLLLFFHPVATTESCNWNWSSSCGSSPNSPEIRFPFNIRGDGQSERCGYDDSGFEVYCGSRKTNNQTQTLINLPHAGEFVVHKIVYSHRKLWIEDPHGCLAKRYLQHYAIDLAGSPFQLSDDLRRINVTFRKCSNKDFSSYYPFQPINCLGDAQTSVVVFTSESDLPANLSLCQVISSALVPFDQFVDMLHWRGEFPSVIKLQWITPNCDHPNCEEASNTHKSVLAAGSVMGTLAQIVILIIFSGLTYSLECMNDHDTTKRADGEEVKEGEPPAPANGEAQSV